MGTLIASTVNGGGNGRYGSGYPNSGLMQYAPNSGLWFCFYMANATTGFAAKYASTPTGTWTVPSGSPITLSSNCTLGNYLACCLANISSTDILHVARYDPNLNSSNGGVWHSRYTLGTIWTTTNSEAVDNTNAGGYPVTSNNAVSCLDSSNYPVDAICYYVDIASNPDSGTWTAGWGSVKTITSVTVVQLIPLSGRNLLAIGQYSSNWYSSLWNGSTWSTPAALTGMSGDTIEDISTVVVGNTVHAVYLPNSGTTSYHAIYNITSGTWAAGNTIPAISTGAAGNPFLATDGTNVYMAVLQGSTQNIEVIEWTASSTSWSTEWYITDVGNSSHTRYALSGYSQVVDGIVGLTYTQANGSNFDLYASSFNVSAITYAGTVISSVGTDNPATGFPTSTQMIDDGTNSWAFYPHSTQSGKLCYRSTTNLASWGSEQTVTVSNFPGNGISFSIIYNQITKTILVVYGDVDASYPYNAYLR